MTVREIAQLIGKLSYSAIVVLPAPLHYRSLQRQQIEEFSKQKTSRGRFVYLKRARRIDLARKQPKTEECEITSKFKTSNNSSFRCINERFGGGLLPGSEDWGPWSKLETKEHIDILELKAAKLPY